MGIPHELIDQDAAKVVRRLRKAGHAAYLVGGCVRDLLLGRTPKDFDVATSATPQETKDIFRNCRIIGRRFRLAHIFFGSKIIETATFRTNPREGGEAAEDADIMIRRDNVFGTAEEDARRRDFTMNGLFYDLEADSVIDYVGGIDDLVARSVRTIGEPFTRFREDPVRILRAIKFAARLGFGIEAETYRAMLATRNEISKCAPPRVLEELYRLLRSGAARRSVELKIETGVLAVLCPELATLLGADVPADARPLEMRAPSPADDDDGDDDQDEDDDDDQGAEGVQEGRGPSAPSAPPLAADARARLYRLLDVVDALFRERPTAVSNAAALAVLALPFVADAIDPDSQHVRDAGRTLEDFLTPLVARLRISRRDSERAKQALLAQRRLAPSRRGGRRFRPQAMSQRDYYLDALILREIVIREAGGPAEELTGVQKLFHDASTRGPDAGHSGQPFEGGGGGGNDDPPRRRRRRGGRRRPPGAPGGRITFAG